MFRLPNGTPMGSLSIFETFEYFDFPRLFTAKSITGRYYLALSILDEEHYLEWLYLEISSEKLRRLMAKEVSLYEVFTKPECGYLLKVVSTDNGDDKFNYILPELLSEDELPLPDAYIEVADKPKQYGLGEITPHIAAKASHRETLNLHLFPADSHLPELNARGFGSVLVSVQELVDAIGQVANDGDATLKGAIAEDILQKTKLNACQIFEGSFGVQLKSATLSDMFGESLAAKTLEELSGLLMAGDTEELLSNKLHVLKGRVASKYRRVLRELNKLSTGLTFDWGSPNGELGRKVELTKAQIDKAFSIVDKIDIEMSESIEINANLIGLNIRTKRYEIESLDTDESFSGRVSDEAIPKIKNATINNRYKANIKKVVETKASSGDETIKWILFGLTPLG